MGSEVPPPGSFLLSSPTPFLLLPYAYTPPFSWIPAIMMAAAQQNGSVCNGENWYDTITVGTYVAFWIIRYQLVLNYNYITWPHVSVPLNSWPVAYYRKGGTTPCLLRSHSGVWEETYIAGRFIFQCEDSFDVSSANSYYAEFTEDMLYRILAHWHRGFVMTLFHTCTSAKLSLQCCLSRVVAPTRPGPATKCCYCYLI